MSPGTTPRPVPVPAGLYRQSVFFAATAGLWRRLGDLETAVVSDEIESTSIERPIYVCSLARAGTTIVTEFLAECPGVTSHRYSDFPAVWTPYWRNWLLQRRAGGRAAPSERAHKDRIRVTPDSPEAVEEVLWNHFFDCIHDPAHSNLLSADDRDATFDRFYTDHIRKLLAVRGAARYLAKGNYNVARLDYLIDLFPDARIVIPVRHPVDHIASLVKQHRLFSDGHELDARVGRQLSMAGHWEFGPDRRPVNLGDGAAERISAAWKAGDEITGWALTWSSTFSLIYKMIEKYSENISWFRYEDLCDRSEVVLEQVLTHTGLAHPDCDGWAARLSRPAYYDSGLTPADCEGIAEQCSEVAGRFGYHDLGAHSGA